MSSCVTPRVRSDANPVVLLHCFDSSQDLEPRDFHNTASDKKYQRRLERGYDSNFPSMCAHSDVSRSLPDDFMESLLSHDCFFDMIKDTYLKYYTRDEGRKILTYSTKMFFFLLKFDKPTALFSSCLEWRSAYPLLEDAGLEAWAIDILGWGFSDLEHRPPCNVASKRYHLYELWKSHIKRPMTLVGPSLGAAAAIDFAVNFPEAVDKLVLINANVYANGTGVLTKLPKSAAYAMASLLKSVPIRWYAKVLVFNGISVSSILDYTNVGRLHCLLPWWEDATVNFMLSGGYNVTGQIKRVKQKTLLICSERDNIVNNKLAEKLQDELANASMLKVPDCGHMPHIEKPYVIAKLIADFAREGTCNGRPVSYIVDNVPLRKITM